MQTAPCFIQLSLWHEVSVLGISSRHSKSKAPFNVIVRQFQFGQKLFAEEVILRKAMAFTSWGTQEMMVLLNRI
ncbi:hypothetical protein [Paenibacillus sp. V4I7]|uniref:hypothetical protein n=1 Tax=Paenibacillus sp. V4I7 TaxID=3042307 RepID=UPI0027814E0C|nr:hypothetical protein [Paenibacillus sp. V4I7]MDQ0898874.1 hypothetical protein [Paenibacillus sp. V4I7]